MALVQAKVVGDLPIVDARDGSDKVKGEPVVLDDEKTRVDVLVAAGLIGGPEPFVEPAVADKKPGKGDA